MAVGVGLGVDETTFSVALLEVTVPPPLLMVTLNFAPLSAMVVGGVVYEGPFAVEPAIGLPFFLHL